ncbi:hypothetical protein ACFYN0_23145 [Streptomyces sp. NPDC006704]
MPEKLRGLHVQLVDRFAKDGEGGRRLVDAIGKLAGHPHVGGPRVLGNP